MPIEHETSTEASRSTSIGTVNASMSRRGEFQCVLCGCVGNKEREFVPAGAGKHCALREESRPPFCHRDQDEVTDGMTEGVVDVLEPVQVNKPKPTISA
ncbi:MAG: hypothetical protein ACI8TP_004177 [Acidimicrobiales bacterium]|jgi:hypothetical protein